MFMKASKGLIPSLIIALFLKSIIHPSISDIVVMPCLAFMYGMLIWIDHKKTPDYLSMFEQKIDDIRKEYDAKQSLLKLEINDVKETYTKQAVNVGLKQKKQSFEF